MMMRYLMLIVGLMSLTIMSNAQRFSLRKLNPSSDNNVIEFFCTAQDEQGFIYLGTNQGLYLYDGSNFKTILSSNQKITALHHFDNKLYIGYQNGSVLKIRNPQYVQPIYSYLNLGSINEISQIETLFDKRSVVFATKGSGLFILNGNSKKQLNAKQQLSDDYIYGLIQDKKKLWIANDKGIDIINLGTEKNEPIAHWDTQDGLPDNIVSSIAIAPSKKWIGLGFQNSKLILTPIDNLPKALKYSFNEKTGQLNHLLFERDNILWAGTEQGYLMRLKAERNTLFCTDSFVIGSGIQKIVKDKAGNLLILCQNGLYEIASPQLINIPSNEKNLFNTELSALAQTFDSTIFYACQKDLNLYHFKQEKAQKILSAPSIITKIYKEGPIIWLGTLHNGVWSYNTKTKALTHLKSKSLSTSTHVIDINSDHQNNLWIASLEGVYRCSRTNKEATSCNVTTLFNKNDGIGSDYVHQITCDSKGRIWMASDGGGPVYFQNEKFFSFKNHKFGSLFKVVYSIEETKDGAIWCSSAENGLFAFDNNQWKRFSKNYGLNNQDFLGLTSLNDGRLIAVQEDALYEYYTNQKIFRKYAKATTNNLDSFASNLNLISKNQDGSILIGTQKRFLQIKPNDQFYVVPQVRIHNVQVFLKNTKWGKKYFKHNENQIGFEFEQTNFAHSDRLYFRYRLLGLNDAWQSTNDKKVTFSNLDPGTYTFEIQVAQNPSFEGAQKDDYTFSIAKAFWQKWWFYAAILIFLAVGGKSYINRREIEIQKKERIQKEKLHFEYEHLKSQINPHFLFNSLNTLVDLIDENTERASDYTIHLAAMYRSLLAYRDKEMISILEEIKLLEHYIFVQKCRFGEALIIDIALEEPQKSKGRIVPLALQLLVENAIKHNEVSRTNPLLVSIYQQDEYLVVHNKIKSKISRETGEGLGITNLQKRYQLLAHRNIIIEKTKEYFIIKLPIL